METDLTEPSVLRIFIRFDLVAAALSLALLIIVQLTYIREVIFWTVPASLAVLMAALVLAGRVLAAGRTATALGAIAVGNWIVAISTTAVLPFLWPVLVVAALIPVVLAAPTVDRRSTAVVIGSGAVIIGVVAIIGLLGDDAGVIDDVDDDLELIAVVACLTALVIPIGIIISHANNKQQRSLARADELNAELRRSEVELATSRRRIVDAADTARIQIERNLHDGAQQRLVALGVHLRLLESRTGQGNAPDDLSGYIAMLVGEVDLAVDELRELAHGIYPPLLEARGLAEAFGAVARRSPLPVEIVANDVGRFDQSIESALYFTGLEALTNAAKHAPDSNLRLMLETTGVDEHDNTLLRLTVSDDGPGFDSADASPSSGMLNMRDRIAAIGGSFSATSAAGAGTSIIAEVPVPVAQGS